MANCNSIITDENAYDFILDNNTIEYEKFSSDPRYCVQVVDVSWMIVSGPIPKGKRLNISDVGYYAIPKLYTPMDMSALDSAGITAAVGQPLLGLSGRDCIIGFIDTGIDYTLDIFQSARGISKIEAIWDQTLEYDGQVTGGEKYDPYREFRYGKVYTNEDINEALKVKMSGGNPKDIVNTDDENGHGTFVAGVAAGSADTDADFIGAAPYAKIVCVKLKKAKKYLRDFFLLNDEALAFEESDILMGIRFLLQSAVVNRLPIVIYMGINTGSGGRTGESPLGETLDRLSRAAGLAVVVGVGNEANVKGHFAGIAESDVSPETVEINVGAQSKGFVVEVWADSLDILSVSIESPTGEKIPRIPSRMGKSSEFKFLLDKTTVTVDYRVVETISGYEVIFVRFITPSEGIWKLNVYSLTQIQGGFNAWLNLKEFLDKDVYFLDSTASVTLAEPSASTRVISVGSYNHITGANDINSGRGYSASGIVKPELCAPGVAVYGPMSGGGYTYRGGTSVAAAITAGAAAILLSWGEVDKNLPLIGTSEVKTILIRGAGRQRGSVFPNNMCGYGSLDLYNAFVNMRIN